MHWSDSKAPAGIEEASTVATSSVTGIAITGKRSENVCVEMIDIGEDVSNQTPTNIDCEGRDLGGKTLLPAEQESEVYISSVEVQLKRSSDDSHEEDPGVKCQQHMQDVMSSIPPLVQKSRSLTEDHEQFALDIQGCVATEGAGVSLASSFPASNSHSQERFPGLLDVPIDVNFGLSSSVPTTSYGDQEEDFEVMQYTCGAVERNADYLQTRRTLEFVAKNLSENFPNSTGGHIGIPGTSGDMESPSEHCPNSVISETKGANPPVAVSSPCEGGTAGNNSCAPSAPLSRASSRSEADVITDNEYIFDDIDEIPTITLGICAMQKKTDSKPMKQILSRLQQFEYLKFVIFEESVILNEPVEQWPIVDCLVSFYSTDFPLDKAIEYAQLRQPFCLNDLSMQKVLFDRREVYKILQKEGLPVPRYAVVDRKDPNFSEDQVVEEDDQIIIYGKVFKKPFVEKPLDAEDHNVTIYFQSSAGGGSQKLFRKIGSVSSTYSADSTIRKYGSYIYEEFKPTDGCDVKVYAVGPEYAHAEARKAPGLDGRVERDNQGKEVRYPVLLSHFEKFIARTICLAFKQTVCGFDLLRANGKSYICDVNGFSFVKNNSKYYDDCAKILGTILLKHMAPDFNIPLHLTVLNEEIPVVPTTRGTMMELRCVIGVLRHGDRQPKQKMKMEVFHESFFDLFCKFGGSFTVATKNKIKLKQPRELQAILDTVLHLLELSESKDFELKENLNKLEQLKSVLQMYGYFSGINRKVQMKCLKKVKASSSEDERTANHQPTILLIAKWGGELTPLGRVHAEALGKAFRCMYPGGASYNDDGSGLLRLHSTFRHDLKIYASDEGRVQMTAAAFAKGLLALDGELTPILVHMVKCAKTNALLDHDESTDEAGGDPIASQEEVKKKLKDLFASNEKFSTDDISHLAPTGSHSLRNSIDVINNPVEMCEHVFQMVQKVAIQIRDWVAVPNRVQNLTLYNNETFEMMARRWGKLEKDFKPRHTDRQAENGGGGIFDISKIPDIYDCIKYDTLHNPHLPLPNKNELYAAAKALADVIVPQEYGMSAAEKFRIALKVCTPLLRKIRCDLQRNLDQSAYRLHPKYSENVLTPNRQVRTRLYFTSESHIHSLVNIIRYGGLFPDPDQQWADADRHLSTVTELNYLSHLVFLLYEDPTKDLKSEERYKLEVQFSPGIRYWEETDKYPVGTKFFPKSPPNIHETSAKEILSFSSGKNVHSMTSSKKSHVLKVATQTASASTSDLTELQQRSRHRSVENLQRRSSSGNTSASNRQASESGAAAAGNSSGSGVSNSKRVGSSSSSKSVAKKKDTNRVTNGKSLAKVPKTTSASSSLGHKTLPPTPAAVEEEQLQGEGEEEGGKVDPIGTRLLSPSAFSEIRSSSSATKLKQSSPSGTSTACPREPSTNGSTAVSGKYSSAKSSLSITLSAFLSGSLNSGSAPNLSSIYQEKMRRENMLPTAMVTSKLLKDFCPVQVLHNNLNVGQLERFLDHVTDNQGSKTPPIYRHNPSGLISARAETIIEESPEPKTNND